MSLAPEPPDGPQGDPGPGVPAAPDPGPALVVYGADWCPDVRRSRALLDGDGVPYRYVDVDDDPAGADVVRRLQAGARRIPTIVRGDGAHLVEPGDEELRSWLAEQGR